MFSDEIVEFSSCLNSTDDERTRKQWFYNGHLIQTFKLNQDIQFDLLLENDPIIDVSLHLVIEMKAHQGKQFIW